MKDITTRVIARELKLDETPVSKAMTRNPVFVLSDTLAVEALQKMVQGLWDQKHKHILVVFVKKDNCIQPLRFLLLHVVIQTF